MIEWGFPNVHRLETIYGSLMFNDTTQVTPVAEGSLYLLDPHRCTASRSIRAASNPVPQGDGEILHARFADGVELNITLSLWTNQETPACFDDARLMAEELHKYLQAILNGSGRYFWQPSNYGDERMLDEARWLVPLEVTLNGDGIFECTFGIDTPFPYMMDKTQTSPVIAGAGSLTNTGNADFWPVIRVGPSSSFTITNTDTGLAIVYLGAGLPGGQSIGGGNIGEIDTFRNSIFLGIGGPPGDDTNLAAGIDVLNTDFWPVVPGTTNVTVSGASATFLMNNAWLP